MSTPIRTVSTPSVDPNGEIVVQLANGCSLRSADDKRLAGGYVRLVDPNGVELQYWDKAEWERDPVLVMGAILCAAAAPDTDANQKLEVFLYDTHGNVVKGDTLPVTEALAFAHRFIHLHGTDPDEKGAGAMDGSISFRPIP